MKYLTTSIYLTIAFVFFTSNIFAQKNEIQPAITNSANEFEYENYNPLLGPESEMSNNPKFWVVNFGTARTLKKGKFGFAAGLGGQMVFLGDPKKTSAFFTIPHAGFRYGLGKKIDVGLRLAPIPLPFATVGPSFGVNLDAKICLAKPESSVDIALVAGFGGAHVLIEDKTR